MLPQMNFVLMEGYIVEDAKISRTPKGMSVCNFSVGVNRSYKREKTDTEYQKEVSFFEVRAWAGLAEVCAEKGKKGTFVRILSARLKQDRWTDAENKNHSRVVIQADRLLFEHRAKKEEAASEQPAEEVSGSIPEDSEIPF